MPVKTQQFAFAIEGSFNGRLITPDNMDLVSLGKFVEDIQKLVRAGDRTPDAPDIPISIEQGSFKIALALGAATAAMIADVSALSSTGDLGKINPVRAEVFQRWQRQASPSLSYTVFVPKLRPLRITKDTRFEYKTREIWVNVEKYLKGELTDFGGKGSPNIHLSLEDTRENITISATRDQLGGEKENLIYRKVTVRVSAEQNLLTNELRNPRLLEFVHYKPFDEKRLWENGAKAWADVEFASAWVDKLRGN
jgi:hypothetical protein